MVVMENPFEEIKFSIDLYEFLCQMVPVGITYHDSDACLCTMWNNEIDSQLRLERLNILFLFPRQREPFFPPANVDDAKLDVGIPALFISRLNILFTLKLIWSQNLSRNIVTSYIVKAKIDMWFKFIIPKNFF